MVFGSLGALTNLENNLEVYEKQRNTLLQHVCGGGEISIVVRECFSGVSVVFQ